MERMCQCQCISAKKKKRKKKAAQCLKWMKKNEVGGMLKCPQYEEYILFRVGKTKQLVFCCQMKRLFGSRLICVSRSFLITASPS